MGEINRRQFLGTGTMAATGSLAAMGAAPASGTLRAGVAKSDITTERKGAVIHDPLYAKVLVLDDGKTRVAIVTMDTTAIGGRRISRGALADVGEDFLPRLRGRSAPELGIPGGHVVVIASHTHPPYPMLCDDAGQIERTLDAVRRAVKNLTPVKVGTGIGYEDRITINRTLRLKNGQCWTIRHTNPSPPDDEVAGVGPIDPEIGILRIDRLDGRPLAVVYNFACHPLFGALRGAITADFPGVASKVIEESLGHDAMALFLQGAGGDIIDILFKDFNRPRDIEPLGTMLGVSILKAYQGIATAEATLGVISETIELPRRTDIPRRIEALEQEQAALLQSLRFTTLSFKTFLPLYLKYTVQPDHPANDSYRYLQDAAMGRDAHVAMDAFNRGHIAKYLRNVQAMERLARIQDKIATFQKHQALNQEAGTPTIPAEVQGIRIGDCRLITAPIELLVEIGLNVKKASPHKYTFVAGFSNGYMHYGPPASEYDKGGYEVTECLLAPQWQQVFESKANEILCRL